MELYSEILCYKKIVITSCSLNPEIKELGQTNMKLLNINIKPPVDGGKALFY